MRVGKSVQPMHRQRLQDDARPESTCLMTITTTIMITLMKILTVILTITIIMKMLMNITIITIILTITIMMITIMITTIITTIRLKEMLRLSNPFPTSIVTVGFHNFNLRIFNLRVSNPNELIVDVFLARCRISMCQGLGPKKHDELSEIDRIHNT